MTHSPPTGGRAPRAALAAALVAVLVAVLLASALPALAQSVDPVEPPDPVAQHNTNALWFENWIGLENATLKVAGPDGRVRTLTQARGTPVFTLSHPATDGTWRYELRADTEERVAFVPNPGRRGGAALPQTVAKVFTRGGSFVVERGVIVPPEQQKTAAETDEGPAPLPRVRR